MKRVSKKAGAVHRTLDQALRIPRALRDKNGGKPWPPKQVAEVLDVGVDGGNFFYYFGH